MRGIWTTALAAVAALGGCGTSAQSTVPEETLTVEMLFLQREAFDGRVIRLRGLWNNILVVSHDANVCPLPIPAGFYGRVAVAHGLFGDVRPRGRPVRPFRHIVIEGEFHDAHQPFGDLNGMLGDMKDPTSVGPLRNWRIVSLGPQVCPPNTGR